MSMLVSLSETCEILKNCDDVCILTHASPDGDCIGSGFALQEILKQLNKRSVVLCSDDIPKRFDFLINSENEFDFVPKLIISVDVATEDLLGTLKDEYSGKINLCIDHHISNTEYAEKTMLSKTSSATCELIYDIAVELGVEINEHIAACIYTGISTDTGCFRFDNTTSRTHEIISQIMKLHDLKYYKINRQMFEIKSLGRIKMESKLIDVMEYYLDNKVTMICITKELLETLGVDSNDIEGCANLPLRIDGVEVGITIKEAEIGEYKVSMRSADEVNVSEICQMLGGGGHIKAAGCLLKGSLEDVKMTLVYAVRKALGI